MTFPDGIRAVGFLSAALLVLLTTRAVGQGTGSGRIEGTVVRIGSGAPLAGAQVTLVPEWADGFDVAPGFGVAPGRPTPAIPPAIPIEGPGGIGGAPGFPGWPMPYGKYAGMLQPVAPMLQPVAPMTTDEQGHFVFENLQAGSYRLRVQADGHVSQEYGRSQLLDGPGRPVRLASGQSAEVVVHLAPAGNVSGRLQDRDRRPVAGVPVQLFRVSYDLTGHRNVEPVATARTNDRGDYRLFWITPGRYYLRAGSPGGGDPFFDIARADGEFSGGPPNPNEVPAAIGVSYFPGAPDIAGARAIVVTGGGDVTGVDWSLPPVPTTHRVRARIVDLKTGEAPTNAQVFIMRANTQDIVDPFGGDSGGIQPYNPATGFVEFRHLQPGAYTITAMVVDESGNSFLESFIKGGPLVQEAVPEEERGQVGDGEIVSPDDIVDLPPGFHTQGPMDYMPPMSIGSVSVTVGDSDIDEVVVSIAPSGTVHAQLRVDGDIPLEQMQGMSLQLQSVNFNPFSPPASGFSAREPGRGFDGKFLIPNVAPGAYRLVLEPLPEDAYVKEARLDGMDVLNSPAIWNGGELGTLDVLISAKGGKVKGTIVDDKGAPAEGVQVVLVPEQRRRRIDLYKDAFSDEKGQFAFSGVAPGSYKIFSWESVKDYEWFDPDLIGRFESLGSDVSVLESGNETVEVRVIRQDGGR